MDALEYKGMNSTRVKLVLLAFFVACYFLIFGLIDQSTWLTVTLGSIISYALSEIGIKTATAYRDRV